MTVPRDLERLLEGWAADRLAPHERGIVDDALAGRDPTIDPDTVRAALELELALVRALDVEAFEGDVAGRVLSRVYRRPDRATRSAFDPDLARQALSEADAAGRLQPIVRPRRRVRAMRVLRPVVVLASFFGLMYLGLRDLGDERPAARRTSFSQLPIGELAYVSAGGDAIAALPHTRRRRTVFSGNVIETGREQVAVVTLPDGGRFIVKPESRVRLVAQAGDGSARLEIERGGVRTLLATSSLQFGAGGTACDGRIGGEGDIMLASDALGSGRPLLSPGLASSMMVSVQDGGSAVFRCHGEEIRLEEEEVGVVGEATLIKLQRRDAAIGPIPSRDWNLDAVVEESELPALRVESHELDRGRLARELLRAHREELFDMLLRSRVIAAELRRRDLRIPDGNLRVARALVDGDELMQAAPLRSAHALEERVFHVAGLLTLAGDGGVPAAATDGAEAARVCRELWSGLATGLQIEWLPSGSRRLFRIEKGALREEVTLAEAWDALRSYLRVSEVRAAVDELVQRLLVETWLRAQGGVWPAPSWKPDPDPALREAQTIFIHLSGMTLRRYADRIQLQQVIETYLPEPDAADVHRHLQELAPKAGRVLFEHWFFPVAGPDRGLSEEMPADAEDAALARAEELRRALARGERPKTPPLPDRSAIWQARWAAGPAPWWDEVYGADFTTTVLGLEEGAVSAPIRGREGYHVVRMREAMPVQVDDDEQHARARRLLKIQRAQAMIDRIVDGARRESAPLEELLR